ncbi:MAG: hypothetical protein ACRDD3_10020 [Azovibrio sp.]
MTPNRHPLPSYLAATLLVLAAACPLPLLAVGCNDLPPSTVTIKRLEAPITTNLEYSYRTLRGMSADYNRRDQEVLGLTRSQAVVSFSIQSSILPDPTGQWECATHQINVEYGFKPITVYVGKEFPEGTCAFKEIYEHEQKHVRAYQDHAKTIEAEITHAFKQRFAGTTPIRGPAGEAQPRLQQELNERWIPFVKRMMEQVEHTQKLIDSPEEYQRVAASCGGSITKQLIPKPR